MSDFPGENEKWTAVTHRHPDTDCPQAGKKWFRRKISQDGLVERKTYYCDLCGIGTQTDDGS